MAARTKIVRFGPFSADLRTGELRREGKAIPLQDLPFRILVALLGRPGELVTRQDLRAIAWPSGVFVDFEHGLNKAVNKIRRALGDVADEARYVETLPGRGYRFIADVEATEAAEERHPPRGNCRILWDSRTLLLSDGANVVGRDPDATVLVDSTTVSRRHALIFVSPLGATLEDLGSKNGTFLRGKRIEAPAPLADGDEIVVGSARMSFHSSAAASTKTAAG